MRQGDKVQTDQLVEWVKWLFDQIISGMDWGSGFFDDEEVLRVYEIADFLGVPRPGHGYGGRDAKRLHKLADERLGSSPTEVVP